MIRKHGMPLVLAIAGSLLLGGCQTPPDIKQLQDQNKNLEAQLQDANSRIDKMLAQEKLLKQDVAELNRVINVLGTEKNSRVQESSSLRGQVRGFVQTQIDQFKEFLVRGNLLDYVGGELVARRNLDEKPNMIVDLANPMPKSGVLTGMGAHFKKPSNFTVKVLRPVENNLVVIWESKALTVVEPGLRRVNFPVSVGVEKGDVIAYHFPESVGVSYDTGTGDTRMLGKAPALGEVVRQSSLKDAKDKRAYSVGVFGLLNK